MNYLLDTHVLLWTLLSPNELPSFTRKEIQNPTNNMYVSAVNFWEISIKISLGKLSIEPFDSSMIIDTCKSQGFTFLNLEATDALNSSKLPFFDNHKDPFDRMLAFQCIEKDLTLISKDDKVKLYVPHGLKLLWK